MKTPVTELNVTLENMILGIGEYAEYEVYLPKCKEIAEQIGKMIKDILSTSRLHTDTEKECEQDISLKEFIGEICEPFYRMDYSRSQETGGNGFGLYIVETILKKMKLAYSFEPLSTNDGMKFTIQF